MGKINKAIQTFLKRIDRFEKPITFSYQKKKQFETASGGICTIIVCLILGFTAFSRLWFLFIGVSQYVENAQTSTSDGKNLLEIPNNDFILTNQIVYAPSIDQEGNPVTTNKDPVEIAKYLIGFYVQQEDSGSGLT